MDNSTRLLIKIKDPNAEIDPKFLDPVHKDHQGSQAILYVHLVVRGSMTCPRCHQTMRKNGLKKEKIIGQTDHDGRQTIYIVRKQKFYCPHCIKIDRQGHRHMITAIMPF